MNEKQEIMKKTNRKKNSLAKTMPYLFFAILVIVTSNCKKDDTPPDCGCNSEIFNTVPEASETVGQISYKEQTETNSYYTNKYWITFVQPDCSICIHYMIVCNESFITDDIINLLNTQESVTVKFAGGLKEVCEKRFNTANITDQRITLTKIEIQ